MKIGILGAGISGLSIGRLLNDEFEVEVLEKKSFCGGIAATKTVEDIAYHVTGGHCFNSKHQDVLDFVFNNALPRKHWNRVERKSVIKLYDYEISYPIEYATRQIEKYDPELSNRIITNFIAANPQKESNNMLDWFKNNFGETLTELYFKPYNEKIWSEDLRNITPDWITDKLPIPSKESFKESLNNDVKDKMPHQFFFYPKSNNQQSFITGLSKDLNITLNYAVTKISYNRNSHTWNINDDKQFDILINTMPLDVIPNLIHDFPEEIKSLAAKLRYNKLTTMLWESKPTENTWTYIPEKNKLAHRYIHIGNFFKPKKNYTIIEAIGEHTYQEMENSENGNPFFINSLDHHISDHAYIVFDENYKNASSAVIEYLEQISIFSLGRFGEWKYHNMDICIKRSMELSKIISEKYGIKK